MNDIYNWIINRSIYEIIISIIVLFLIIIGYKYYHRTSQVTRTNQESSFSTNQQSTLSSEVFEEQCVEFGPVTYYANARHNMRDKWFKFHYKKEGNVWLTYIIRMPNLNGRSASLHDTHRYSNNNRYWICYDPQPSSLSDAVNISRAWADRELEYIATGTKFENQRW